MSAALERHRLGIGRLETRCTALAGPAAAARMGAALDRALARALPPALAREAEAVLDGLDGVVRIRRLALRLDLGERFAEGGIAAGLAARIATALRTALARGGGDVRIWPDHAAYLADYVLRRLGLASGPAWPFSELAKLDHLPAERAAAELIRARPAILLPLARASVRLGAADAAVARWPEAACAELALALLRPPLEPAERRDLLPALRALAQGLPAPAGAGAGVALAAATLSLALRSLAAARGPIAGRAVVVAAAAFLAARQLHRAGPRAAAPDDRAVSPPAAPDRHAAALAAALALVRQDKGCRAVLDELLALEPDTPFSGAATAEAGRRQRREPGHKAAAALRTPFAGLALLWPSALATGAVEALAPTALAQAAWQTLDAADWPAAAEDPALALLFPVDPRAIDLTRPQPPPPADRLDRLDPAARAVAAAAPAERGWSALLLGDLASRLRGLRGASHGWLALQFLRRPGSVAVGRDTLTVRLDPVPLVVVLRMAGLAGPQQRLKLPGAPRLVLDLGDAG